MKSSDRLGSVARLYDARKQEQARRVATQVSSLERESARLDELQSYREEYTRFLDGGERMTPERLRNYAAFLDRLNEAVTAQKQRIASIGAACQEERARLVQAAQRSQAVENAVDRRRGEERRGADRAQQNALDDRNVVWFRPPGGEGDE